MPHVDQPKTITGRGSTLAAVGIMLLSLMGLPLYAQPTIARTSVVPAKAAKPLRVELYTAAWCQRCRTLKAQLKANRIDYQEYDVETSRQGRDYFVKNRFVGVPITVINGVIIEGYDARALMMEFVRAGRLFDPSQ
jgi:glutaredoxin